MEVAASAVGIVSLSLQLIETINKIRTFVRDVKDAPKELLRLGDLLGRLGALIQDIRTSMENQKSLLGQQIPAPSLSIFQSLKACEKSLEPLLELVKKCQDSRVSGNSTMAKLKSDIRLGMKTKDILEFETRIQHEINYLQVALLMNMTNIVTSSTVIYQQQTIVSHQTNSSHQTLSQQNTLDIWDRKDTAVSRPSHLKLSQSAFLARSSLDRFGVHKQSLIRYMHSQDDTDIILSEEHQYFWNWRLLGYGLHWRHYRETIIPSLSVYPVVPDLYGIVESTMRHGTVLEFQEMLSSGSLHPFTRDRRGRSLLHLAATYQRGDFCRLLYAHGLRPDLALTGETPLLCAFDSAYLHKRTVSEYNASTDTIRGLLETSRDTEDFETKEWTNMPLLIANADQLTNWLWDYITNNYSGSELLVLQAMIFKDVAQYLGKRDFRQDAYTTLQSLAPKMAKSDLLLDEISLGNMGVLQSLWDIIQDGETMSQETGSCYIALLTSMGIDVKRSIEAEIEQLSGGILHSFNRWSDRKIFFYQDDQQDWVLRWEWELDKEARGYDLLSGFPRMTIDELRGYNWPFHELKWGLPYDDLHQEGPKWDARRARRLANAARKELSRTGQKRPRSRMPGAWI